MMCNDTAITHTELLLKEESNTTCFLQILSLNFREQVLKLFCFSYLVMFILMFKDSIRFWENRVT